VSDAFPRWFIVLVGLAPGVYPERMVNASHTTIGPYPSRLAAMDAWRYDPKVRKWREAVVDAACEGQIELPL
jgi:hypothetical protein